MWLVKLGIIYTSALPTFFLSGRFSGTIIIIRKKEYEDAYKLFLNK